MTSPKREGGPERDEMIIIALDLDGVLHRSLATEWMGERKENKFFYFLPKFESVIRDYPCTRILITSSWRELRALGVLAAFFSEDIRPKILGVTPIHNTGNRIGLRQREVRDWLKEHGLADVCWVSPDDDSRNYLPDAPLIFCEDGFGAAEEKTLRLFLDLQIERVG